jgi:ABC-type spermidine/putrescine transport system permease subunit II
LGWIQLRNALPISSAQSGLVGDLALATFIRWLPILVYVCAATRNAVADSAIASLKLHRSSPLFRGFKIIVPSVLPHLLLPATACAFLGMADAVTCGILQRPGQTTYSMRIFGVMDNAPEKLVAAMCLCYLATFGLFLVLFFTAQQFQRRFTRIPRF